MKNENGIEKSAILTGQTLVNYATGMAFALSASGDYCIGTLKNSEMTSNKTITIVNNNSYGVRGIVTDLGGKWIRNIDVSAESHVTSTLTSSEKLMRVDSLPNSSILLNDYANSRFIIYDGNFKDVIYFEGMQSVQMPVLTTTGKNLFNYEDFKNTTLSGGATTKYPINLEPNTTYTFSDKTGLWNGSNGYYVNLQLIDENDVQIAQLINSNLANTKSFTFTTSNSNEYYIFIHKNDMNSMDMASSDFQIEQGTQATSYEPFKSIILTVNEDDELRGIGEVKDTLDCLTGEVTQRIGEVVVDGSNDEEWECTIEHDIFITFHMKINGKQNSVNFACDKLPNKQSWSESKRGIWADNGLIVTLNNNEANSLIEFRKWLSQNPLTIQYQLATESVKTVDLTVVNQDGENVSLKPIEGTMHLSTSSETINPLFSGEIPVEAITQNLASFIKE